MSLSLALLLQVAAAASPGRFQVSFPAAIHAGPITGRVFLFLSKTPTPEPRLLVSPQGPVLFGVDVDRLPPGKPVVFAADAPGYPDRLGAIPPGDYCAQALIHVYDEVHRADGHRLWLAMNDGTVETFTIRPGNLYGEVRKVRVGAGGTVQLVADKKLEAPPPPPDTDWIKQVRIQSAKLTAFWGRPIYIHATVLLPKGYADHPEVRYPTVFAFGFGRDGPFSFDPDSSHYKTPGAVNPATGLDTGFDFYRAWTSDGFPRVIAVTFEQSTPYFPDSYSVNSANNGPYGDAMVEEVIPALERQFRMIPKGYARHLEGASTNGWQSLALQLKYPDSFGGAWVLQPDPIDFRRYQLVDIYQDANAFTVPVGQFHHGDRPFKRTVEGQTVWTVRDMSRFEAVLGTHGRAAYQLEGWEAVYGPVGPDGYPVPLWDKATGAIDHQVAEYMRANGYDLLEFTKRNWPTLGPKITGKLHFFAGDMDDFMLNLGVYRYQEFLRSTADPHYEAEFTYGRPTKGHAWHAEPFHALVRRIAAAIKGAAPVGEPVDSWWY